MIPPPSGSWYRRYRELIWSVGAGFALVLGVLGERLDLFGRDWAVACFAGASILGGLDLVRHWVAQLRKGRLVFNIDLLMLLAAVGAAVLGAWAEGALLLFLFSLAHALEHYALGRARQAIRALGDLAPARALVLREDTVVEVAVEAIVVDDIVLVRSGSSIPVDGVVVAGDSSVNQAPITGESVPVSKAAGDEVFAGTINGTGVLQIRTTRAVGDRTLDRVIRLVEEAQDSKAPTQLFTERFEKIFVPAVLLLDLLLIGLPPLLGWWTLETSFYRGMALLVAASPCALALGTPATVLAGIAQAARSGILIKGGAHLEMLGRVGVLALDKTGTLTLGTPEVTDVTPTDGTDEDELLAVAAAVEQHSEHPLAEAVVRAATTRTLKLADVSDVESVTGRGIRGRLAGTEVMVGSLRLWQDAGEAVPAAVQDAVVRLEAAGRSTMAVRVGERWLGVLGVADRPQPGVATVIARLRRLGLTRIVILTGDNPGVGHAIGREVGVDEVQASLLPEDKVTAIRELLEGGALVAMVGDGVNDAPALAHATVGIAMGGAGTAVALETADVALMSDDLGRLPFAVGLSRQSRRIIQQNLVVSMSVIAVLILATVTGLAGIGMAVVVHEGSSLLVVMNALRLLRYTD